jgi:hypothetical protein
MKHSYKFLRVELLVRWSHMRKEMNYIPTRYDKSENLTIQFQIQSLDYLKCQVLN